MKAFDIFVENQLTDKSIKSVILEHNIAKKLLADPKRTKMMAIAISHDWSFPKHELAKLGDRAEQKHIVELWGRLIDNALANNPYGDLSREGTFDDWLTNMYINGAVDYEEIVGESGDAMGFWKRLGTMVQRTPDRPDPQNPMRTVFGNAILDKNGNTIPVLLPAHRNLNSFKTLGALRDAMRSETYSKEFEKLQNAAKLERMASQADLLEIMNDNGIHVRVMFNYAATFTFARGTGVFAEYCTGFPNDSGQRYARSYLSDGMIVGILNTAAEDPRDINSKFQMLAYSGQLRNAKQDPSGRHPSDELFASLYPGLMKKIVAAIQQHGTEIHERSKVCYAGGYDIDHEIGLIRQNFPLSYASEEPQAAEPEAAPANAEPHPDHIPGRD